MMLKKRVRTAVQVPQSVQPLTRPYQTTPITPRVRNQEEEKVSPVIDSEDTVMDDEVNIQSLVYDRGLPESFTKEFLSQWIGQQGWSDIKYVFWGQYERAGYPKLDSAQKKVLQLKVQSVLQYAFRSTSRPSFTKGVPITPPPLFNRPHPKDPHSKKFKCESPHVNPYEIDHRTWDRLQLAFISAEEYFVKNGYTTVLFEDVVARVLKAPEWQDMAKLIAIYTKRLKGAFNKRMHRRMKAEQDAELANPGGKRKRVRSNQEAQLKQTTQQKQTVSTAFSTPPWDNDESSTGITPPSSHSKPITPLKNPFELTRHVFIHGKRRLKKYHDLVGNNIQLGNKRLLSPDGKVFEFMQLREDTKFMEADQQIREELAPNDEADYASQPEEIEGAKINRLLEIDQAVRVYNGKPIEGTVIIPHRVFTEAVIMERFQQMSIRKVKEWAKGDADYDAKKK